MTVKEAIAYIEDCGWSKTRLGLGRTRELLARIGNPQKKLRFVHVTGSNGKGSTCAMLARILMEAGYRTGLYISPYIQHFCERIQINGKNISDEDLAYYTSVIRSHADTMPDHPSQFELTTAIAMAYFADKACDIVVLEVGMGGALDSTNVIDSPEIAVLTNIGLEHTEYLGDTLEAIAKTKAGIIKAGCHAVAYPGAEEASEEIRKVCRELDVPLRFADLQALTPGEKSLDGQTFFLRGKEYHLSLIGDYQLKNAAVVMEVIDALRERGWKIPESAVFAGLASVTWPARMEILCRNPLFVLDGGHNPQCARALTESLASWFPGQPFIFLTGVLAEKDYPAMMQMLMPFAEKFICLTPESDRALPAWQLAEYLQSQGAEATAAKNISDGIRLACAAAGEMGAIAAFGSLYQAGAIRSCFGK